MMANEPTHTSKATALFLHDYMYTIKPLRKGEEITILYAPRGNTQFDTTRSKHGYKVVDDGDPRRSHHIRQPPQPDTLRYYTTKWFQYCTLDTGAWSTPPSMPPPRGIPNLGQTCFLNASTQALLEPHLANLHSSSPHYGASAYTGLLRNLSTLTPPPDPSPHITQILHHCNTHFHRSLFLHKQAEVGTMFTDLVTMGPEPDRWGGRHVLHVKDFRCEEEHCGATHGTANFTQAIVLPILTPPPPHSSALTITLEECITRLEPLHLVHRPKCLLH